MRDSAAYPFEHVQCVRELGTWDPGAKFGRRAKDEEIVPWCHKYGYVIVTCDTDFRSAEMRRSLLHESKVEVIWFKQEPADTREQMELIVKHYPTWLERLQDEEAAYRQWMQTPNGRLTKMPR